MERLTSNKETKDMTMIELAHNSCYADSQHNARYRDYNLDIDSRQLVRNLLKDICDEDLAECTDEEFEEYMGEMLSLEMDSKIGLLALFYRNLWAMADLREKLKEYEDLEEQDRLVKLPCKVGDTVYEITGATTRGYDWKYLTYEKAYVHETVFNLGRLNDIGKTVFLTQAEAEQKLKELRGEQNGKID